MKMSNWLRHSVQWFLELINKLTGWPWGDNVPEMK